MENKEALHTLTEIRNLMEKSTKFSLLSGLSILLVGIYACIATWLVYLILSDSTTTATTSFNIPVLNVNTPYRLMLISVVALVLLFVCLLTVFLMSHLKAKKAKQSLYSNKTLGRLLQSFFVPLITGGIFCFSLLYHQYYGLTSSIMLIFYGLALVNCSKYTYSHIRYLGYAEIILGLIDSFVVNYALFFWVTGFGLFHILFGIIFYLKTERKQTHLNEATFNA